MHETTQLSAGYLVEIAIGIFGILFSLLSGLAYQFHKRKAKAKLESEIDQHIQSDDVAERIKMMAGIAAFVGEVAILYAHTQHCDVPASIHYTKAIQWYNKNAPRLGVKPYRFMGIYRLAKDYVDDQQLMAEDVPDPSDLELDPMETEVVKLD